MLASWRARGGFLLLAAILLVLFLPWNREPAPKEPPAEKMIEEGKRPLDSVTAPDKETDGCNYVRPAYTRIIVEIDGVEKDLGPVLLPELLLDSPDARLFNQRVEQLYQKLARYYQTVEKPAVTWNYQAEWTDTEMKLSLWETDKAGEGQSCCYTVNLATGEIPYLKDTWKGFPAENHAQELVSTRYEGFLEPSWYSSLVLPEILLDSPDAEAVNREIETMYRDNAEEIEYYDVEMKKSMTEAQAIWDPWWDNVWYTAYQSDGILSVGITCDNVFGCRHVQRGWNFDLETGRLLRSDELLSRMGVSQADFLEAVRQKLIEFVGLAKDQILEDYPTGEFEESKHAAENYLRLCEEIRAGAHDPEAPAIYITDTGEIHLSVWNPSCQYYGAGGDGDWTEELALTFSENAG